VSIVQEQMVLIARHMILSSEQGLWCGAALPDKDSAVVLPSTFIHKPGQTSHVLCNKQLCRVSCTCCGVWPPFHVATGTKGSSLLLMRSSWLNQWPAAPSSVARSWGCGTAEVQITRASQPYAIKWHDGTQDNVDIKECQSRNLVAACASGRVIKEWHKARHGVCQGMAAYSLCWQGLGSSTIYGVLIKSAHHRPSAI
jgi:hypothetical protein